MIESGNRILTVVVVNYNGVGFLLKCISALLNASISQEQIVVVDNGSSDGSVRLLRSSYEKIRVISLKRNYGYAVANNAGIKVADSEYVLLVNNDTVVSQGFVRGLMSCMESNRTVSAVQSCVLTRDSPPKIDSIGSYFTRTGFLHHDQFGRPLATGVAFDCCRVVFSAKGACLLLRKSALQDVGLFDESFFLYFEETDLCWRMWLRGFKVMVSGASIVIHEGGETSRRLPSSFVIYHSFRNRIASLLKNLERRTLLSLMPIHLGICLFVAVWYGVNGKGQNGSAIIGAILWNLRSLNATARKRQVIQRNRRISDADLFRSVSRRTQWMSLIRFGRVFLETWH